jgi:hypothetical protein
MAGTPVTTSGNLRAHGNAMGRRENDQLPSALLLLLLLQHCHANDQLPFPLLLLLLLQRVRNRSSKDLDMTLGLRRRGWVERKFFSRVWVSA